MVYKWNKDKYWISTYHDTKKTQVAWNVNMDLKELTFQIHIHPDSDGTAEASGGDMQTLKESSF